MSSLTGRESLMSTELGGYVNILSPNQTSNSSNSRRQTPQIVRGNSRASSRGPFIYISRRPDEEEPQINYPLTDSQILKKWAIKMAGLFLIGVAIFAGLIVPGFALTKAMILEDPITYGRIWECYRFQFLVTWILMSIFICFVLAAIVNIIQSVIEYKESRERLLNPREARERANRGRYTLSRLRAIPDPILDAVVEVGH